MKTTRIISNSRATKCRIILAVAVLASLEVTPTNATLETVYDFTFEGDAAPAGFSVVGSGTASFSDGQIHLDGACALEGPTPGQALYNGSTLSGPADDFGMEIMFTLHSTEPPFGFLLSDNNGANHGAALLYDGGSKFLGGLSMNAFEYLSATAASTGIEVRMAYVRSGGTTAIYVNNVLATTTGAGLTAWPTLLTIGANRDNSGNLEGFINASIRKVRVFTFAPGQFNPSSDLFTETFTWGGGNSTWSDPSAIGWNGGPPFTGDSAIINSGTVSFAQHDTFGNDGTSTSANIHLNGGTLASAGWFNTIWNLDQNGGTLLCNGGAYPQFPAFQLAGTLTASGSNSINVGSGDNNIINIGGNGNSTLTVSTPTVTDSLIVNAPLQDSRYGPNSLTKTGLGTLTLNAVNAYTGDTSVIDGTLAIGENGVFAVGSSFGRASTMVINSGAVVNAGGSGGTVTATYIGGKINNTGTEGVGTLTINGGILNVAAGSATGTNGDCTHVWLNPYGGTGSTINLNSGTLSSARPIANGSGGEAYFNFNGGVLQAADDINLLDNAGTLTVNLMAGGGTIDTNGFLVSVLPSISGSGSLTKTGTGLLVLTGTNGFSGDISINDGTLAAGAATGGIDPVTSPLGNPSVSRTLTIGAYGTLWFTAHDVLGNAATAPAASVVIDGGRVTTDGHLNSFNSLTLTNGGSVTGDNSSGFGYGYNLNGTVYSTGITTNTMGGANFYLNRITGNTPFDVASGSTLLVSSPVINSWDNIAAGITKAGAGTLSLTGPITYSGNTTITGGTLSLGQINPNSESSTVSISVAAGAKLDLAFTGTEAVSKLFIDGTQQPAGNYTRLNPSGAFTGGGTLNVISGPAGFVGWIAGTFANGGTVPTGQQGMGDDPDHDGVINLIEYAIAGLDPTVSNGSIGTLTTNTLSYTKRQPIATDITYVIETSPDFKTWTPQVTHGPDNTDATITYTLPAGQGQLFGRLRVEQ